MLVDRQRVRRCDVRSAKAGVEKRVALLEAADAHRNAQGSYGIEDAQKLDVHKTRVADQPILFQGGVLRRMVEESLNRRDRQSQPVAIVELLDRKGSTGFQHPRSGRRSRTDCARCTIRGKTRR